MTDALFYYESALGDDESATARALLNKTRSGSYTGVIDDKRPVRPLLDAVVELDQCVVLEPRDLWWGVTCDHRARQYNTAMHADRLSLVLAVQQHLRRHYNQTG